MDDLSELEIEGFVQRFEYTFELAWKVLQDLLIYKGYEFMLGPNGTMKMAFEDGLISDHVYKGYEFMLGPNGTMKMAFEDGLISDHDGWRKMAKSRNTLSHVYDEEEVLPIVQLIFTNYAPMLKALDESLGKLKDNPEYSNA